MDWADFANAVGTCYPGLGICTIVFVVAVTLPFCRLGWVLGSPQTR